MTTKTPRERAFEKLNEERDLARHYFTESVDDHRSWEEWKKAAWRYIARMASPNFSPTDEDRATNAAKAASVLMAAVESHYRKQDNNDPDKLRQRIAELEQQLQAVKQKHFAGAYGGAERMVDSHIRPPYSGTYSGAPNGYR